MSAIRISILAGVRQPRGRVTSAENTMRPNAKSR